MRPGWFHSWLKCPNGENEWENYCWKLDGYCCALACTTVQSSSIWIFISCHNVTVERKINLTYPPSSEYLCPKARMSEARPLPSHTTTGTGGVSLRYSRTIEMTFGPPSTIRATTGTPCPIPADETQMLQGKAIKKIKGERCFFFLLHQFNVQRQLEVSCSCRV